jgi:hypothetical protein
MSKMIISFSLNPDKDRRIVQWLNGQQNKSAAIREALEAHLGGGGITLSDIYWAVRELERKIGSGASAISVLDSLSTSEPPDVAANLDALGL